MRVLIYEPLPDMNRAPIIAQLARTLVENGHDVLVALEEKLIYTLLGKLTHQGVINCSRTWRRHIATSPKIKTYRLDTPPGLYWFVTQTNLEQRLSKISAIRKEQYTKLLDNFNPQRIFVWNGQHEHLRDFLDLAKKTHVNKFIYMECGWFPQKGTIYFDSEGVNASSSIAKLPARQLEQFEKEELSFWLTKYKNLSKSRFPTEEKTVFVPLQVDTDTNVTLHSPFRGMQSFVNYLERWIPQDYSAILRPHPLQPSNTPLHVSRSNFQIDSTTGIADLIDSTEIVVGINSTVLLEAITRDKPVISLGDGFLKKTVIGEPFHNAHKNRLQNCESTIYELALKRQDFVTSCKTAVTALSTHNDNLSDQTTTA